MLTISKAAASSGVSTDTLRYYEREGLIRAQSRTPAGYRLYDPHTLRRIRFIRDAQQCGFSLAEIAQLFRLEGNPDACCRDVRQRAVETRLRLSAKITAMQQMVVALDGLIAACGDGERPLDECGILTALEAPLAARSPSAA